jgi:hypothetical protein
MASNKKPSRFGDGVIIVKPGRKESAPGFETVYNASLRRHYPVQVLRVFPFERTLSSLKNSPSDYMVSVMIAIPPSRVKCLGGGGAAGVYYGYDLLSSILKSP